MNKLNMLSLVRQTNWIKIGLVAALSCAASVVSAAPTSIERSIGDGTVTITDPNSKRVQYTYDEVENLTEIKLLDSIDPETSEPFIYSYDYDEADQLTSITYPGGAQQFDYNPDKDSTLTEKVPAEEIDQVTKIYDFAQTAPMLLFNYDPKGRITWITYPQIENVTTQVCYEYNADHQLTRVGRALSPKTACSAAEEKTDYFYDKHGRLLVTDYPNGIDGFREYDPLTGQIAVLGYRDSANDLIYKDVFEYELGSQLYKTVTRVTPTSNKVTAYEYDAYQRLTTVTEANGRKTVYEYDDFSNRTKETITNIIDANASATGNQRPYGVYDYVYISNSNRLDQIKFDNVIQEKFTHDDAGRITRREIYNAAGTAVTETTDYVFNDLGKLTQVTLPNLTVIDYTYDGLGVRKTKTVTPNGGTAEVTKYLTANLFGLPHVLMEMDSDLGVKASYVYAGGQVLKEEPGTLAGSDGLYMLHGGTVGNITHVVDKNGSTQHEYEYDAFGVRSDVSSTGTSSKHYGYTGEEFDLGSGLVYLRARYYDPSIGRFISADPYLGRLAEPVTQNRFVYVHGNPVSYRDPSGLVVETGWDLFNVGLGTYSLSSNVQEGNWGWAMVDAAGLLYDGFATAVPFLPAGASAALTASRAGGGLVDSVQVGLDVAHSARFADEFAAASDPLARATTEGTSIHRSVGESVDGVLSGSANNYFAGANGATGIQPDISWNSVPGIWGDLTTSGSWASHVRKYESSFGEGIPILYERGVGVVDTFRLRSGASSILAAGQGTVDYCAGGL
ncbi:RHS repeat-associated core domain-containing protein [Pseudomonadota bacterium]